MKIENHSIGTITQGFNDDDISVVKINEDAMEFVSQMFQNDIYSNKLKAAIRETVANAIDEHNKFNVERPVEISFVKESGANFLCIRDFAKGLDEENLREVFGGLFCSTKKLTNDSTGGFGIGAKSPICYSENFFVTSFFGGRKVSFMFFRDKGKTGSSITKIAKYGDSPTHEPTGIEVRIPIKNIDEALCVNLTKAMVENLSPKIGVVFHYEDSVFSPVEEDEWEFGGVKVCQKKSGEIKNVNNLFQVFIRMGSINYPLPFDLVDIYFKCDTFIEVPIGTFSMPPSRETLSDTTENLNKWNIIANSLKKAYNEARSSVTISFKDLSRRHLTRESFSFPNILRDLKLPLCSWVDGESSGTKNIIVGIERSRTKDLWFSRVTKFQRENPDVNVLYYYYDASNLYDFSGVKNVDEILIAKKDKRFREFSGRNLQKEFSFRHKVGFYGSIRSHKSTIDQFRQSNPLPEKPLDLPALASCESSYIDSAISLIKQASIARLYDTVDEEGVCYACASAVKILEELGYLNWNSADVQKTINELKKRKAEEENLRYEIEQTKDFNILSVKTKGILHQMEGSSSFQKRQAGLTKARKIKQAIENIAQKSPLHKKLIDKYVKERYSAFNRKEIKHILKNI